MNLVSLALKATVKIANKVVSSLFKKKLQIDVALVVTTVINLFAIRTVAEKNDFSNNDHSTKLAKCHPEEEIYLTHHVVKNVQTLNAAKVVLYLEVHNDIHHHLYKVDAFDILRSKSPIEDVLLLEALDKENTVPCDSMITCLYPAHDGLDAAQSSGWAPKKEKNKKLTENRMCSQELNKSDPKSSIFFAYRHNKRFSCRGWDTAKAGGASVEFYEKLFSGIIPLGERTRELVGKIEKVVASFAANKNEKVFLDEFKSHSEQLVTLFKKYQRFLSKEEIENREKIEKSIAITTLKNYLVEIKLQMGLIRELEQSIDSTIHKTADELEMSLAGVGSVVERNKSMINAIEKLSKHRGKIFVAAGKRHLISVEEEAILPETETLPPPKVKTEQHDLRAYLKNKPHALIIPKAKQIQWRKPRYRPSSLGR